MMYNLYKVLFEHEDEDDFLPHFQDEWMPTEKDWYLMVNNLNNHASLHSIFSKIQEASKIVRYYLVAKAINWPGIQEYYEKHLRYDRLRGWLLYDEFEIIENENIEIPEVIVDFMDNMKIYDKFGGIALLDQDLGTFIDDKQFFKMIEKFDYIEDIKFDRLPRDSMNYYPQTRILTLVLKNGSITYAKISRWSPKKTYSFKTLSEEKNAVDFGKFKVALELHLFPYKEEKTIDPDFVPTYF